MARRYFVEIPITGSSARLTGTEAHHLKNVIRGGPGDEIIVFDGSGTECTAVIVACERREVQLEIIASRDVDNELPYPPVLAATIPKGDRQRWLVEKAVELGVGILVPLQTTRAEIVPKQATLQRLRRAVIEASKQCRRNRLLAIDSPRSLPEVLDQFTGSVLLAHPGGVSLRDVALPTAAAVLLIVGPEGGFAAEEIELATAAGSHIVDLGRRILRVETAAAALASWVAVHQNGDSN